MRTFKIFTNAHRIFVADWTEEEVRNTGIRPSHIAEFPLNQRYRMEDQMPRAEALLDALNAQLAATPPLKLVV